MPKRLSTPSTEEVQQTTRTWVVAWLAAIVFGMFGNTVKERLLLMLCGIVTVAFGAWVMRKQGIRE